MAIECLYNASITYKVMAFSRNNETLQCFFMYICGAKQLAMQKRNNLQCRNETTCKTRAKGFAKCIIIKV